MGARTLEEQLRLRLLAVVAPALVGVGAMSVAVTAYVFDASDRSAAVQRSWDALHALETERGEGDSFDIASSEVLAAAETDGVRVGLRPRGASIWREGGRHMPSVLLAVHPGSCDTAWGPDGELWRACASGDTTYESLAAVPVASHRATLWSVAKAMAGVVALGVLGVLWAVRHAVRGPMQSLARLVQWSEQVGDDGAPTAPPADTADVQQLVASFERLVQRLFETLARERANSAHIAHELRTPLTSILAELDALPPTDAIARVRADVVRLARVVEAILVLSAPQGRRGAKRVVNLADLARELAPALTVVDAPDEALVEGDSALVTLALQNLLENARRYSGHEARVLRVSRTGGSARVSVIDDGPGVSPEVRARMFERHWRAASDGPGSGLGLALVRAVAEHHHGTAEALANPGGKGLEVAMILGGVVGWHDERR
jgi:signal transduction histidine kinase